MENKHQINLKNIFRGKTKYYILQIHAMICQCECSETLWKYILFLTGKFK